MPTPYRDPTGVPCPRCDAILQSRDEGGLLCASGCGERIAASSVTRMLGDGDPVSIGKPAPYFKVTALPPTRCLACNAALDAVYRSIDDTDHITLGRCAAHGVWVERRTRRDFERAYNVACAAYADARVVAADPDDAASRIVRLERRVAELEAQLAAAERRLSFLG